MRTCACVGVVCVGVGVYDLNACTDQMPIPYHSISERNVKPPYAINITAKNVCIGTLILVFNPITKSLTYRWLYWSDWGFPARIERCSLDGQDRETLIGTGLVWPNALTIDLDQQILYWADANLDKIESSFVNGSNRQIITQSNVDVQHPFSITHFDEVLYWTDWLLDGVLSIPLDGSTDNATILVEDLLTEPMGIQVFTEEKQPSGKLGSDIFALFSCNTFRSCYKEFK